MLHVGVDVSDGDFAFALARSLSRNDKELQIHLDNIKDCDLILSDRRERRNLKNVLYLSGEINRGDFDDSMYKYSDCRYISNMVLEHWEKYGICDKADISAKKGISSSLRMKDGSFTGKVISFLGTTGGCGVTSTIMSLSVILSEVFDKRVLYFNLQSKDSSCLYLGRTEKKADTQRLFYYLKSGVPVNKKEHIAGGIPSYIKRNETDDFVYNAEIGDLIILLEELNKGNPFHYIFLDFGTELSQRNADLIHRGDGAVVVKKDKDNTENHILNRVKAITSSVIMVNTFCKSNTGNGERLHYISFDESAFENTESRVNINLKTLYGGDMWKFAKKFERLYGRT